VICELEGVFWCTNQKGRLASKHGNYMMEQVDIGYSVVLYNNSLQRYLIILSTVADNARTMVNLECIGSWLAGRKSWLLSMMMVWE
jgi:hypothetical protein